MLAERFAEGVLNEKRYNSFDYRSPVKRQRVNAQEQPVPIRQTLELVDVLQRWAYEIISNPDTDDEYNMSMIRSMLLTLLSPPIQRRIFFYVLSFRPQVEVVKGIFGSPPYAFLGADDSVGLNADGISHSRSHVSYSDARTIGDAIENYAQFGVPVLLDAYGREYKVKGGESMEQLVGADMRLMTHNADEIKLVMRIKKVTKEKRREMMQHENTREALRVPKTGTELELTVSREYSYLLKKARANKKHPLELPSIPPSQMVYVRAARQRSVGAATAELLVTLK